MLVSMRAGAAAKRSMMRMRVMAVYVHRMMMTVIAVSPVRSMMRRTAMIARIVIAVWPMMGAEMRGVGMNRSVIFKMLGRVMKRRMGHVV